MTSADYHQRSNIREYRGIAAVSLLLLGAALAVSQLSLTEVAYVEPHLAARDAWRQAARKFREVGDLIGEEQFEQARRELQQMARRHPAPYSELAAQRIEQLDAVLPDNSERDGAFLAGELGLLCHDLGAPYAAIKWLKRVQQVNRQDSRGFARTLAWTQVEVGQIEPSLAPTNPYFAHQQTSVKHAALRKQGQIVKERTFDSMDFGRVIHAIDLHYIKHPGLKRHNFAALAALTDMVNAPLSPGQSSAVYQRIFECLANLRDEEGLRVWEDDCVTRHEADPDRAAAVLMARASRLIESRRRDEAMRELRSLRHRFPTATPAADAGYEIALLLMQKDRHDEAMHELRNIVEGEGHAAITWPSSAVRRKAAFALGTCFEVRKEYANKLRMLRVEGSIPDDDGWDCTNARRDRALELKQHALLGSGRHVEAAMLSLTALYNHWHLRPATAERLVSLYRQANQLHDLRQIIASIDEARKIAFLKQGLNQAAVDGMLLPGKAIQQLLDVEELVARNDVDTLLEAACSRDGYIRLESPPRVIPSWPAANALARMDKPGFAAIAKAMEQGKGTRAMYHALAKSPVPAATDWLVARARAATDFREQELLFHCLAEMGDRGTRELHQMAMSDDPLTAYIAKREVDREATNPTLHDDWPPPATGSLPKSWPWDEVLTSPVTAAGVLPER